MCRIISDVTYRCGHVQPWCIPRDCEYNSDGSRRQGAGNPLCILPSSECDNFGFLRVIKLSDNRVCTDCHVADLRNPGSPSHRAELSAANREEMITKIKMNTQNHVISAKNLTAQSEKRAQLLEMPPETIDMATRYASLRIRRVFETEDAQFKERHFEDLLQIIKGVPLLNKARLVGEFAALTEVRLHGTKFADNDIRYYYDVTKKDRDFGDEFRKGLSRPEVLDVEMKAKPKGHQGKNRKAAINGNTETTKENGNTEMKEKKDDKTQDLNGDKMENSKTETQEEKSDKKETNGTGEKTKKKKKKRNKNKKKKGKSDK
ncbi:hypothetical protein F5Y16DRAFT_405499 [Xylariaceae sp. FL0255]|nr:hypothetical protein F5Y16DRAFT_405499 [Xylariaceae sp. FL0255]